MKAEMITLEAEKAGEVDLDDAIFGLEPRADILHRVVRWQLAKRRAGTHKVKSRGEVSYSKAKIGRQKGSGSARHGSRAVSQFRHGGVAFGPKPRDHGHKITKKFRRLGLRHALSAKMQAARLVFLDAATLDAPATRPLRQKIEALGWSRTLLIDGTVVDANFRKASGNLPNLDILPSQGANVHDILRCETLVLTREAVRQLETRLK